jgi:hypothetical protein
MANATTMKDIPPRTTAKKMPLMKRGMPKPMLNMMMQGKKGAKNAK